MKNSSKILALVLSILLLYSCQEEAEIEIDNPQFSVAYIQETSQSGVSLSANVYNSGKVEIIEHGFMITRFPIIPRFDNSEIFSIQGAPSKTFEVKVNHSLEATRDYNVVAYIKTSQGYVYSVPEKFRSEGSDGFIFESIDIKNPIYFGDTITVFGTNLSNLIGNYEINFNGIKANVVAISSEYFKFTLPLISDDPNTINYNFNFKISGKTFNAWFPITFREPELYLQNINTFNFIDTVVIRGKYLGSNIQNIENRMLNGQSSSLEIISNTDSLFSFKLNSSFISTQPTVNLTLRNRRLSNVRLFNLNQTELDPDQEIIGEFKEENSYEITGENFNSNIINGETILVNGNISTDFYPARLPEPNKLYIRPNGMLEGRVNQISIRSMGKESNHSVKFTQTNPDIKTSQPNLNSFNYSIISQQANSFNGFRSRKLLTIENAIFEIDFEAQAIVKKMENWSIFNNLNTIFNLQHNDHELYISTYSQDLFDPKFYKVDLTSNTIKELPSLPIKLYKPRRVFSTSRYLYIEGGQLAENVAVLGQLTNQRWRFDLTNETWEKLTNGNFSSSLIIFEKVNKFNNSPMLVEKENSQIRVMKFEENLEGWVEVKKFQNINTSRIIQDFILIDSDVFTIEEDGAYKLNLNTGEANYFSRANYMYQKQINTNAILIDNSKFVYFTQYGFLGEFDPKYLLNP
ncbi:IPT/TIG domain-containing protein [Belliella sp. R4-6]|uniref:IPT/TIG domain-containing protein n=1 Tax=Belliella alkalica TaxID=1730871 RepID=A0ABS9VD78_9BACT|nr:IPT/TIG domain-containing protein [Belliella alkalica]MCH7414386.1 IPT/TIG domain-containing protein [Belliella alkalica]